MTTQITGGKFRGAKLFVPAGAPLRPTLGRMRIDLFNLLRPELGGARFLDLFAGAGTIGLEAVSRGAASCVFVESDPHCAGAIRQNLERLKLTSQCEISEAPAEKAINTLRRAKQKFDIIFLDPPYELGLAQQTLGAGAVQELLDTAGMLIAQTGGKESLTEEYGAVQLYRTKKYRATTFWFYRKAAERDAESG